MTCSEVLDPGAWRMLRPPFFLGGILLGLVSTLPQTWVRVMTGSGSSSLSMLFQLAKIEFLVLLSTFGGTLVGRESCL